ncbi:hypothetical protein K469DRAFT_648647 [Zopfia rhizophila CBS 207.26]|uniref:Cytochrome P450 n=1 Tax=Zopfia rhizophila CBS 207.26 TaxID=1314779 RepID=A0A6A6EVM7_9PEZI|nr:hypothetical protein K469DRAFT_648647 [Zopfia rhizophila CBS 207.26]
MLSAQAYSVHRSRKAFPYAEDWKPERWEMVRHFWLFGLGQGMCPSMNITWVKIRVVTARILSTYGVSLVE